MSDQPTSTADGQGLLELYDAALPEVYGYLVARCGSPALAEDLTSETFLAAAAAIDDRRALTVGWLIRVARNKLVDHWRRRERDERRLGQLDADARTNGVVDDWEVTLDAVLTRQTLDQLGSHHRVVLTLRYFDGLPVAEVAACVGRTTGATEVLLVRARRAFRAIYEQEEAR